MCIRDRIIHALVAVIWSVVMINQDALMDDANLNVNLLKTVTFKCNVPTLPIHVSVNQIQIVEVIGRFASWT